MTDRRIRPYARSVICQIHAIRDLTGGRATDFNKTELAVIEGAFQEAAGRLRFKRTSDNLQKERGGDA
jgi:hypothetical protein